MKSHQGSKRNLPRTTADKDNLNRQSNDLAGGLPRGPGTGNLSADEDMDDDTGLSNRANQQQPIDQGNRQAAQSNVGRRDDGTPD